MLAPMAGVTGWAFREIAFRFGADVCVSEFHPAVGVARQPRRLLPLIGARHGDRPFVVQLFGRNPDDFRAAARVLADETSVAGIDINMGCPVERVVNSVHGCALMNEPGLAGEIVAGACAGSRLPVTVKIRSGWSCATAPEFARVLEAAGARAIVIHGRTREQGYRGAVDLEVIRQTKEAVRIPVIGNGDVDSPAAALAMLKTGVDGVMIGRAAVGNPWLFSEVRRALKHDCAPVPELGRAELVRLHALMAIGAEGPHEALPLRKHLIAYSRGNPRAAHLRRLVAGVHTLADAFAWANELAESLRMAPPATW